MVYRTLLESRSCFAAFDQKRKCPMLKCFKRFDEPTDLMRHLFDCENLSYGEVECWKCSDDWHEFPNNEKGWAARLDLRKKGKAVRKGTSQLLRKLSGRRGGHHKIAQVTSHADDDMVPFFEETLLPDMIEEVLSTAGDSAPLCTSFPAEFHQNEVDSGEVTELAGTQFTYPPSDTTSQSHELSYSELLTVSPISPLVATDGGMDDRSNVPSQTYLISPRQTIGYGPVPTHARVTGLTLQNDIMHDNALCASPEASQPDYGCESPPWITDLVQSHNSHRQSSESILTGCTLQSPTGKFHNDLSVCSNSANLHSTRSPSPAASQPPIWHSASSSGGFEGYSMFSRSEASPSFSELPRNSSASERASTDTVAETKQQQQLAELDGAGAQSRRDRADNEGQNITVSAGRKTIKDERRALDLVCEECGYRPEGLERNKRSHMSRHRKTHRKESYTCTVCGRSYSREDNMKKHEKSAHPEFSRSAKSSKRQAVESCSEPSSETHPKRYRVNYSSFGHLNHFNIV